jgi:hypothetical protein
MLPVQINLPPKHLASQQNAEAHQLHPHTLVVGRRAKTISGLATPSPQFLHPNHLGSTEPWTALGANCFLVSHQCPMRRFAECRVLGHSRGGAELGHSFIWRDCSRGRENSYTPPRGWFWPGSIRPRRGAWARWSRAWGRVRGERERESHRVNKHRPRVVQKQASYYCPTSCPPCKDAVHRIKVFRFGGTKSGGADRRWTRNSLSCYYVNESRGQVRS